MAAQLQMPPQFLDWMLLPISGLNDHGALWDSKYRATDRLWSEEPNEFVASIIDEIPVGRPNFQLGSRTATGDQHGPGFVHELAPACLKTLSAN